MKHYLITGYYYNSERRFRITTQSLSHAMCINLWRGRVWEVTNGKRRLIKQVYN